MGNERQADPRPIQTRYAGCRFRSRLEARWAVFFDTLGIEWEYEPQGYLVGPKRRPYLPDFWLPGERLWVEVKGSDAQLDIELLVDAAFPDLGLPATGRTTEHYDRDVRVLILGPIARGPRPWVHGDRTYGAIEPGMSLLLHGEGMVIQTGGHFTNAGVWSDSDGPAVANHIREIQWQTREIWEPDLVGASEWYCASQEPGVQQAYEAARSARFEHGESGAR